jgi:hypothetical protein
MNHQENPETNQAIEVEDLTVEESVQHEVKGGLAINNLKQIGLATVSFNDMNE